MQQTHVTDTDPTVLQIIPGRCKWNMQSLIAPTSTPEPESRALVDPGMQCNPQHSPALQAQEAEAQELSHVSAECQKCLNAFHVSRHFCFRDIVHRNLLAAICKRNDSQDFRFQGCWLSSWLRTTIKNTVQNVFPWDLKKWGSMTCPNFKAQLNVGVKVEWRISSNAQDHKDRDRWKSW